MVRRLVKRVLMIAYHFPPAQGSSGIQRTLKFCQYLPDYGWEPIVLTVNPRAYLRTDPGQLGEIREGLIVKRAFALDTARHLALGGRYFAWMALPDRWVSWSLAGTLNGAWLIKQYRPAVLWSTYPIATAHMLGLTLRNLSGLPWVADFRDSMTEEGYPADAATRRTYQWIESHTAQRASRAVFTTPGALRMYAQRYPDIPPDRWAVIPNGYDEENFRVAERAASRHKPGDTKVLLHSGVIYRSERDPSAFFGAIADLRRSGQLSPEQLQVILRASGDEDYYQKVLNEQGIHDIVHLEPAIPYKAALIEMMEADGLLLFQGANCNHQIPAKLYEYLRAGCPIFALTDGSGDTAAVLRESGRGRVVPLDSREQIRAGLLHFLAGIDATADQGRPGDVTKYSRQVRTGELSDLFTSLVTG